MTQVIKVSGNKEAFDEDKLKGSLQRAAIAAKRPANGKSITDISAELSRSYKEKPKVSSEDIKEDVLKALDDAEPKVSEAWRQFDSRYKRR
jgi:transcriptional regulator NrdR family protein